MIIETALNQSLITTVGEIEFPVSSIVSMFLTGTGCVKTTGC